MSEVTAVRLSKILKEYNIALATVNEFIKKKGYNLELTPNSRVEPEIANLIETEFSKDKKTKDAANNISLPNRHIEEAEAAKRAAELAEKEREKKEKEQQKKLEEQRKLEEQKKKEAEELERLLKEQQEKERLLKEQQEKEEQERLLREKQAKEEQERLLKEQQEKERLLKEQQDKEEQAKKAIQQSNNSDNIPPKDKNAGKNQADKNQPEKKQPENQQTEQPEKDEVFRIHVDTIQAPKVIAKIELPVEKPKPSKQQSQGENASTKKPKRKRLTKDPVNTAEVANMIRKKDDQNAPKKEKDKDKELASNKKNNRGGKNNKKKEIRKVEISEEEVKKQVHETLSSLEQKGKSRASVRRREKREQKNEIQRRENAKLEAEKSIIKVTEFVTVNELATLMNVPVTDVIKICMDLGVIVSINQRLNAQTLSIVAEEFGYKVEFVDPDLHEADEEVEDNEADYIPRNPIVTVMGHVDHGKTSLLDYIRNTNVIAGEAGGITQHVGAYEVHLPNGRNITFLDTPGHEAFTAMRARGAQITDVVIVVVAADDHVMPQTIEAINHAQAAGVPIIIAINKIDKPTADVERIKRELSNINILVEDWGGKYQCQEISAKKGINIDLLLEKVLLEADILDLKGNPNKRAEGTVIESELDKGRGYMAKILVQDGTLHIGDIVLAGICYGRVKAMFNERNQKVESCGPSSPTALLGLNGAPQAGDKFIVMKDERETKSIASKRSQLQRELGIRTQGHITLEEIGRRIAIGDFKELNIIIKADVDGSVEALTDSLIKLSTPEVQVNVIHKSVGQITETDVSLAAASDAIIIGFQVRPSHKAKELAERDKIDIRTYSVIYKAIEELQDAIVGMLSPEFEEKITCNVEVRETYNISKVGTIAGCYVQNGVITRGTNIRVIRDGVVIHTGRLGSLKRFKDDVKEVKASLECGLNIENFNDVKIGDIIEGYEEVPHQKKV